MKSLILLRAFTPAGALGGGLYSMPVLDYLNGKSDAAFAKLSLENTPLRFWQILDVLEEPITAGMPARVRSSEKTSAVFS